MKARDMLCDLHAHSAFSDGTLTPKELVELAEHLSLGAVALTDHNTVAGLPEFMEASQGKQVAAVPGVEFSTEYHGIELHILGLWIQPENYGVVTELLNEMVRRKECSNLALVETLGRQGIVLDYEKIKAATPQGQVNRALIALEMTRLGYTASVKEAFSKWLSEEQGFYQPPRRLEAMEVIAFIRSIHAAAVLAHPFLKLNEAQLRAFIKEALPYGLDGIETEYPLFSQEETILARRIADENGLLRSGGSDFHGQAKPDIALGAGKGLLAVPMELYEKLLQRVKERMKD